MTRPEPKYKKVDKWVYGEVKEIELIAKSKGFLLVSSSPLTRS